MLMRGGVLYVFLKDVLSCGGGGDGDYRLMSKLFFFLI